MRLFIQIGLITSMLFAGIVFAAEDGMELLDKVEKTDPASLSEKEFYEYEAALIKGYSGSGGNFLDEQGIEWLKSAVANFDQRGIKLKDEWGRNRVIANSFLNAGQYAKALEEYRLMGDQSGVEESEWLLKNRGSQNVQVTEYPGQIPYESSEGAVAADPRYIFKSYFKGPVFRYDKDRDTHAIIYVPETGYQWCDSLIWDGRRLVMKSSWQDTAIVFDSQTNNLSAMNRTAAQ